MVLLLIAESKALGSLQYTHLRNVFESVVCHIISYGAAIFRSGTAPTAIETGHYNGINLNDRKCFTCEDLIEDEMHVLLHCPMYDSLRADLFHEAEQTLNGFMNLTDIEKKNRLY